MKKKGIVLIVDDNRAILSAARMLLEVHFSKVLTVASPQLIMKTLREEKVDAVLLDMNFSAGINSGNEGLYWLSEIKKARPSVRVVLFTAYADISLAVRGIKEGAFDFVVKPYDNEQLVSVLKKCITPPQHHSGANSKVQGRFFWGFSETMLGQRPLIEKVSRTEANILITGENGTGKEMLAQEIHAISSRSHHPLITIDSGAIAESLFESELFGHVKGAFTDARSDRAGKFEAAHTGTLFLDEIGNLPYHLQAKLLSALQSRSITRIGSNVPIPVDIRLICATNKDLGEMVAESRFREDLLYRINTIQIEIPPLRKRPEDILPFAELFMQRYAAAYHKPIVRIDEEAGEKLKSHVWGGNVRELQHAIEKAVIIADGDTLLASHFDLPLRRPVAAQQADTTITTLEEMEYRMIKEAINQCDGNLTLVASRLGISRQTLYNKLKRFGI
ncbi:MAG: sigma-54 dependent transcriptional regulator [Tannerellaceae bacterium]|jgi:DNA-binding NtrC family response regulator|nr:sigma-54 dependent transcriptional regulator [Tannerellaceae bacterium]